MDNKDQFILELEQLVNRYSVENGSNTPDFIIADYLYRCLLALDVTINNRTGWYGKTSGKAESATTASNSAMVPCPKWINCAGDVCLGDPFKENCGDSPCLVLARHQ